ncbi:MAG TPA: hypothetical protein VJO53_00985 [Candidatus Acidoferrales bacterium]|nr:hypothetical protein [Candidatus Acidoferrales bacterium]
MTHNSRRLGAHVSGSIPTIVRSFKSIAARRIREHGAAPTLEVWQRGYFERIIRSEEEFGRIWEYIRLNPATWNTDEENPESSTTVRNLPVARS